jgi:hypothetical protein
MLRSVALDLGLDSSINIIRMMKLRMRRWAGHVAHMREMKTAYKILVEKLEEKRPPGGSRRRWDDNIKTGLRRKVWKMWNGFM